jgi:hypothetical protein
MVEEAEEAEVEVEVHLREYSLRQQLFDLC